MDRVWPIRIVIHENRARLAHLDPEPQKRTIADYFEPWITKKDLFDPFGLLPDHYFQMKFHFHPDHLSFLFKISLFYILLCFWTANLSSGSRSEIHKNIVSYLEQLKVEPKSKN